jgi:predicted Zn-dependent protease
MSEQSQATSQSSFFNLHVEGVGYLNRVRTVKPKKGQEFLACNVAAMRGSTADLSYTKFDCKVSGAEAQKIVKLLESDVAAEKTVIIGFKIADIYPEIFTFEKGDRKGQPGVSIKGRLLRVKFAKVNGESVDLPEPVSEHESVAA